MPSRRSHTNSHHGCLRCKSKRVKCDQTQPKCLRCQKRGAECIYRHLLTSYDPFETPGTGSFAVGRPQKSRSMVWTDSRRDTSPTSALSLSPTSSLDCTPLMNSAGDEYHLFHHYMTNLTTRNMAPVLESEMFPILNPAITRNAMTHTYVQQAILCFSALHLASASTDPTGVQRSPHLVSALRHKAAALAHFRPILASGVTPENCEATFTASAVLVACSFALPIADPTGSTGCDRIELLAQVAGLFRGCLALFRLGWKGKHPLEQFRSPEVRKVIHNTYNTEVSWPAAERAVEKVLHVIEKLEEVDKASVKRKASLAAAAQALCKVVRRVAASERDYSVVCMWLGRVDLHFISLLQNRDPLALVLMAHWSACRRYNSDAAWWTRGWPNEALAAIVEALQGRYTELLDWCLSEVPVDKGPPKMEYVIAPRMDEIKVLHAGIRA